MSDTIAIQTLLSPALTPVLSNRDYDRFAEDLRSIDEMLRKSALESMAVEFALEGIGEDPGDRRRRGRAEFAVFALRAEILRHLLGMPGFAAYSTTLASSDLLSDFCGCRSLLGIRWTSKSSLQRASSLFSDEQLRQINALLVQTAGSSEHCSMLGLREAADLSVCLIDSTCLEADVHHPTDWVLLRDVARTLLKAVKLIRREGLRNRMSEGPEELMREMNRLCIEMTHTARKPGSRKPRKRAFRKMKRLLKRVGAHGKAHRDLLDDRFAQTGLSRAQAGRVVARVDEMLALIPRVCKQAHERVVGGRQVPNAEKILSAYDADIDVVVRGKAGASVEFGNELSLAESPEGLIMDYFLYGKGAPGEGEKMRRSLERQRALEVDDELEAVVGDRGYDGKRNLDTLEEQGIASMICPRDPAKLAERLEDPEFSLWQRRRGGTEARIAILKNHGGGRVWRAKGLCSRRKCLGWSVLAHNLAWTRRRQAEQASQASPKAA